MTEDRLQRYVGLWVICTFKSQRAETRACATRPNRKGDGTMAKVQIDTTDSCKIAEVGWQGRVHALPGLRSRRAVLRSDAYNV